MKMIEITESKVRKMSEHVEDILEAGGKLMLCLEKLSNEMYGERRRERDDDDDEDEMLHKMFGNRRMRR